MRWLLTFIGFNALLFVAVLLTLWAFGGFAGEGLSGQGWFAMGLGIVLTSGIGVALMALVFYSARKDYDEDVYRIGRPECWSRAIAARSASKIKPLCSRFVLWKITARLRRLTPLQASQGF